MTQKNSNEKRLAALQNRKLTQSSQNELVRNALSDKAVSKITKFSDSDDDDTQDNQLITDILHDVDEEEDVSFAVKPQFLGKKGEKLMTMQSKIGSDNRFQLDTRFESGSESNTDSEDDETREMNNERQTLYNTMDSVLGGLGITAKPITAAENQHVVDQYVRFDPTDVNHEKFLVSHKPPLEPDGPVEETILAHDSNNKEDEAKAKHKIDHMPIVDESTFFEVKTDFNKTIAENTSSSNGFSFKFDFAIESSQTNVQESDTIQAQAQDFSIKELQHDSSDEEETIDTKTFNKDSAKRPQDNYFFYSINPLFKKGPISEFKRTKTMEEIEQDWISQRQQLTAEYKKRHKDAVRFQKKFIAKT